METAFASAGTGHHTPVFPWPALEFVRQAQDYWIDAAQRSVLFLDLLRRRGNDHFEHIARTGPNILSFLAEKEREAKAAEDEKTHRKELFLSSSLTPETIDRIMRRVRGAAENGETETLLGHFPSAWCTDGGRKINAREDGWPDTLQGVAREFYEFWQHDLKTRGFLLSVEIISFPGGMPGDVGVTLAWGA